MSHILDALKKVQDEKAAQLKQTTMTGGALLAGQQQQQPSSKRKFLIAAGTGVAVAAAALFWLYRAPSPVPARAPAATQMTQQLAAIPLPPVGPPQTPAPVATPIPPQPAQPVVVVPQTSPEPADTNQKTGQRQKARLSTKPNPDQPKVGTLEQSRIRTIEPEGIRLAGIAWQENRANRRAVVNDQLVGEGGVINGVRVLEIKPTMVRFEKAGIVYETTLPR